MKPIPCKNKTPNNLRVGCIDLSTDLCGSVYLLCNVQNLASEPEHKQLLLIDSFG